MEGFIKDIRLGWRSIRKNQLISLAVILTLGIGMGGATVMFAVLNNIYLRHCRLRMESVWFESRLHPGRRRSAAAGECRGPRVSDATRECKVVRKRGCDADRQFHDHGRRSSGARKRGGRFRRLDADSRNNTVVGRTFTAESDAFGDIFLISATTPPWKGGELCLTNHYFFSLPIVISAAYSIVRSLSRVAHFIKV